MHALDVLEFGAVRERLATHCETEMGARQASRMLPVFDEAGVWELQDWVRDAYDIVTRESPPSLARVGDYRSGFKLAQKGAVLGAQEVYRMAEALAAMRQMKNFLWNRADDYPLLWKLGAPLPDEPRTEQEIFDALDPDGEVKDSASPELAAIRRRKAGMAARILEKIQSYVSGRTREILSDPLYTVRDGRYVIPVRSEHRSRVKGIVHDTSASGQTVYIEPEDVLNLGNQLREIEAAERDEIQAILGRLSAKLGRAADAAIAGTECCAELDFLFAKVRLGLEMRAVPPKRVEQCPDRTRPSVEIHMGRHPLLDPDRAVPLSISVGIEEDGVLITGPNTGGKTVAIKTIGLLVLMAQAGLLVPAESMRLKPFTQVWADIGDEQSIQQSLSTFSGHIRNIAEALKNLKPGALALFDELGAGTDPAEGAALAKAILLEFQAKGARIVASTHYGELKAFAYNQEGFQNAAMEFDAKTLRPTYRLIMGAPGASHALKIAERYGLPAALVDKAREGLTGEQQDITRMLEKLEQAQRQARVAQSEADRRSAEAAKAQREAEEKARKAEEARRQAAARSSAMLEDVLRQIRLEAAEVFESVKKLGADARSVEKARAELKALQELGQETVEAIRPVANPRPTRAEPESLRKGASVRVQGYAQVGTVLDEPKGGQVKVQMGPLRLTVAVGSVELAGRGADAKPPAKARPNIGLEKARTVSTELHLRAMRAEDAERELERFLDDAVLGGLSVVRIVHGKGEGILRKLVHDYLRRNRNVGHFHEADPSEGGAGVTVAHIG